MDQFTIRNTIALAVFSVALATFTSFDYIDSYVISFFIKTNGLRSQLGFILKLSSCTILVLLALTPQLFRCFRLTEVAGMAYLFAGILIAILCIANFINFYIYLIFVTLAKASLYVASLSIISVSLQAKFMSVGRLAAYLTGSYHFALFVFNSLAEIIINPLRSNPLEDCKDSYCLYDETISQRFKIYVKVMLILYGFIIIPAFLLFIRKRPQQQYQRVSVNYSQIQEHAQIKKPLGKLYLLLLLSAFVGNIGSKLLQIKAQVIMEEVLLDPGMAHLLYIMTDSFIVFSSVVWAFRTHKSNIDQFLRKIQLATSIGVIATGISGSWTILCCLFFISAIMLANALIITQVCAILMKASKQQYLIELPFYAITCYFSMLAGQGISLALLELGLSQLQSISMLGVISTLSQIGLEMYLRNKLELQQQQIQ